MIEKLRGQLDNARLLREAWRVAATASKHFDISRALAFRRAIRCMLETRIRPQEALDYGLLAPDAASPAQLLSKRDCARMQKRQNARDWFFMTEDKGIFHQFCVASGIPVPQCHALLFRNAYGIARERPVAPSLAAWTDVLETLDLTATVIKPCRSSYARGVLVLEDRDGKLVGGGQYFDGAAAVARFMHDQPAHRSWLVQQRLHSHPTLNALSGTPYLQTVRIYTHVGDDGEPRVVDAFLKVIGGDAVIDNFEYGRHGNFVAPIDLDSGALEAAIFRQPDYHWQRLPEHPRTGQTFREFRIPDWQHTLDVMRRAAECFRPIRALAWDVAVTQHGPVVVEANIHWDPPNWSANSIRRLRPLIDSRAVGAG